MSANFSSLPLPEQQEIQALLSIAPGIQKTRYLSVACTALIFYDILLTFDEEVCVLE